MLVSASMVYEMWMMCNKYFFPSNEEGTTYYISLQEYIIANIFPCAPYSDSTSTCTVIESKTASAPQHEYKDVRKLPTRLNVGDFMYHSDITTIILLYCD